MTEKRRDECTHCHGILWIEEGAGVRDYYILPDGKFSHIDVRDCIRTLRERIDQNQYEETQ